MTSPYEIVANQLETIINTEFAADGLVAEHDRLHDSIGHEGARICIYPESEKPLTGRMIQEDIECYVKYLGLYDKLIEPEQAVDPRPVTRIAERLRRAIQSNLDSGSPYVWLRTSTILPATRLALRPESLLMVRTAASLRLRAK
jgi:hypothetical protein